MNKETSLTDSATAKTANRVVRHTLYGNITLAGLKLLAGLLANSAAMVSDAIHSFSDVLGETITLAGIRMSGKQADKEHPYGHERLECVSAIILSFILFAVGALIGYNGLLKIIGGNYDNLKVPGILALFAAVISIITKEIMYQYTIRVARKLDMVALKASAWHHRSDAISSLGSFAGIWGARQGFPILDSVACVVICAFIIKVAVDIFKEAISKMTDRACDDSFVADLHKTVMKQQAVLAIDRLDTRLFGNKVYVEVEIVTPGDFTLIKAHDVAQKVHDAIEKNYPTVKHCMVHVNPPASPDTPVER